MYHFSVSSSSTSHQTATMHVLLNYSLQTYRQIIGRYLITLHCPTFPATPLARYALTLKLCMFLSSFRIYSMLRTYIRTRIPLEPSATWTISRLLASSSLRDAWPNWHIIIDNSTLAGFGEYYSLALQPPSPSLEISLQCSRSSPPSSFSPSTYPQS